VAMVALSGLVVVAHQTSAAAPTIQTILEPMRTLRRHLGQAPDDQRDNMAAEGYGAYLDQVEEI